MLGSPPSPRPTRLHLVRLSLGAVAVVALATFVRSVMFHRSITAIATLIMLAGAVHALRGRTWGVGVVLAVAAAFPAAHVLGMAPWWFWLVGVIGAVPFVLSRPAMVRFDRCATALFAAIAVASGIAGAFAYHEAKRTPDRPIHAHAHAHRQCR